MPRPLTGREAEVEALRERGLKVREIAERLGVGVPAVSQALRRARDKRGKGGPGVMTERRGEIVRLVWRLAREKGAWPTYDEACAALRTTKSGLSCHAAALRRLGLMAPAGKWGALQLLGVEFRIADTPEGARLKEVLGE